jgi:hypothetical protein
MTMARAPATDDTRATPSDAPAKIYKNALELQSRVFEVAVSVSGSIWKKQWQRGKTN